MNQHGLNVFDEGSLKKNFCEKTLIHMYQASGVWGVDFKNNSSRLICIKSFYLKESGRGPTKQHNWLILTQ